MIVAGGGDGTVSAVASAIAGTDASLGILPFGTLNHFAKDVGVPLDLDDAIRAIAGGRTVRVDVGEVDGRPFINNASVGMYASLIAERDAMQRLGRRKWIAHGLAAARVWRRYRRLRSCSCTEGQQRAIRTPFVFVGNNEYQLSGLEFGGRKRLDAGPASCVHGSGHVAARSGTHDHRGHVRRPCRLEGFESFTTSKLTLDGGAPLRVSVDGEVIALDHPLAFRSRPGALRVIVP